MGTALLLLSVLLTVTGIQNSPASKKVIVGAPLGWQNSGIRLRMGQYYSVKAFGTWVSGLESQSLGPGGDLSGRITADPLVGWIAEKQPERLNPESYNKYILSKVILLGGEGYFRSYSDGFLWLAMGDWSGCKECLGKIDVIITVYE